MANTPISGPGTTPGTAVVDASIFPMGGTGKPTTTALIFKNYVLGASATNIFIGNTVGNIGITGTYNIVLGFNSGTSMTGIAQGHILFGHGTGAAITTGHYNIGIGEGVLAASTTSGENVGIGFKALQSATGEDNIGIGYFPGAALSSAGRNNIFLGYYAGCPTLSGSPGTDYTSGNHSIFIGSYATAMNATENGQINIGNVIFSRGNGASNPPPIPELGNVGIYVTNPTARLHLPANSATANKASLKINSGTLLSVTENGAIESDGTKLYWTSDTGLRIDLTQSGGGGGGGVWGSITGTLTDQTDLVTALATKWNISGTTTITSAATITNNVASGLTFNGTWTAAANNDYYASFGGTLTARGTGSDNIFAYKWVPSIALAGTTQTAVAFHFNPTFSGGTGGPIYTSVKITGPTSSATHVALRVEDSANATLLQITSDGSIATKTGASFGTGQGNFTFQTITPGSGNAGFNFNLPGSNPGTGVTFAKNGGGQWAQAINMLTFTGGMVTGTASQNARVLNLTPTWNLTASYTGDIYGIDYNPTNTSLTGLTNNYALRARTGKIQLDAGDLLIDSTTRGLIIKDTNGHYWRLSINTSGVLAQTDIGTGIPVD